MCQCRIRRFDQEKKMDIGQDTTGKCSGSRRVCAAVLFCAAFAITASAQTLTTLVDFAGASSPFPSALIQGSDGNFYATTKLGGTNNLGSVFKLTPSGTLITLYSFCSRGGIGVCTDGEEPTSGVVQAANGNFYGTTTGGGHGFGTIFTITPKGKIVQLYSFCTNFTCPEGKNPNGLVQATNGNLYGTAAFGGQGSVGTVFEITTTGDLTALHSFSGDVGTNPFSGLVQAANGNLYGTTLGGSGTLFEITPTGTLTTLHTFGLVAGGFEANGLVFNSDGNIYGTTAFGGTNSSSFVCDSGCGTVFSMTPAGEFAKIYNFCAETNCSDGAIPEAGVVLGSDGNFYGTTQYGGNSNNAGTIFKITPQGALTTIYTFCAQTNCTDGAYPGQALLQSTDGNFYGTTVSGGTGGINGPGTIFRLSTGLGPFVKLVRDSGSVGQVGGILGQWFTGTTGVSFNGTPASFTVVSDTLIQTTVPAGATSGYIKVQTPGGTLTSNLVFHVRP
jgi:uncharacterized repeat protein (TIGR03803 family)